MAKLTDTLGALLQRRKKLLAERKADPLIEIEAQIAEIQGAAAAEARAKAEAEKAARLADLRKRETLAAAALVTVCDALAMAQAEYVTIARGLYALGQRPAVAAPPLQFDAGLFMQEWRARLQPPSAEELRELAEARAQRARIIKSELDRAIEARKELENPTEPSPFADKSAALSFERDYPGQINASNAKIEGLAQEIKELTGAWPHAANAYVPEPAAGEDK